MLRALLAGFAGAVTLNLIHETVRRARPEDAPRMDVLGMRALTRAFRAAEVNPPPAPELHTLALIGDVVVNSLYYSLTGTGKHAAARGLALGTLAGMGGVLLPGPLGLGEKQSGRTPQTMAMTVVWYTLGGLAAGLAGQALGKRMSASTDSRYGRSARPWVNGRGW